MQDSGLRFSARRLVALAGGAACGLVSIIPITLAQDSVSAGNGLPGDATSAYAAGLPSLNEQINNFVLDLAPITSSWGNAYRAGPIAKASQGGSAFFTHLIAPTAVSNRFTPGPFPRTEYFAWHAAGQGTNALQNLTPQDDGSGNYGLRSTAGLSGPQFALAFMEFGGGSDFIFGTGDDEQNVIVALAGFEAADPSRIYVSRVAAAQNKPSSGGSGTASFGIGGIDSTGSVHILADGFGMTSGSAIPDKRLLRVNAASRAAVVNQLASATTGDAPAVTTLLSNQILQTAPAVIPSAVASRPVLASVDFAGSYLFESAPSTLTATSAWASAGESPRGPVSLTADGFTRLSTLGTSVATLGVVSKSPANSRARSINLWGASATGAITGTARLDLPAAAGSLIDPLDAFDPSAIWGNLADQELTSYASQVSFRGPSGPVAMTVLPGGDLLVAATIAATGSASAVPQSLDNYIVVGRVAAATGSVTWSIAAHTGNAAGAAGGLSKVILGDNGADGIPASADAGENDGTVDRGPSAWIARIARASEGPQGTSNGPSISPPAMDRLGNLYFLATTMHKTVGGGSRFSTSLLRANFDPQTGGFELERLLDVGDIIAGQNSTRNYQIQFMSAADGDSVDSGAIFPSSVVQDLIPGVNAATVAYASPASLGALVVRCRIVYDRDNSGTFVDPTIPGNSGSPDQAYSVALILMPQAAAPANPADFNGDGEVNPDDLGDYINCYFEAPPCDRADFNNDGDVNPDDLGDFINVYFG